MFIRLKEKPFYFITDRETHYTFLINNATQSQKQNHRYLYYPDQFETMTTKQIKSYKNSLVNKLMWWSLFNSDKMTSTDKRICYSKLVDYAFTLATGILCASFTRRILFRIEFPFFQMALQDSLFSARWVKSAIAYSFASFGTYHAVNKIMKEDYLVDLAF